MLELRRTRACVGCSTCETRRAGLFADLDRESLARLDRSKTVRKWRQGQVLFHEGRRCSSVFCLRSGLAKISKYAPHNRRHILHVARPGDVLALENLLTGDVHTCTAEMLQEGEVCEIDRGVFTALLDRQAALGRRVALRFADQLVRSQNARADLVSGDVRERLAATLLTLGVELGTAEARRLRVAVNLTREDLAEMIGATQETTIRQLSQLREAGVLSTEGRTIVVEDSDRLARVAWAEDGR